MHTHTRTHTHTHGREGREEKSATSTFCLQQSNNRTGAQSNPGVFNSRGVQKTGKGSEQSTPHTVKILLSCCCRCCSCLEVPGVFGGRGRATQCVQGAHTTSSSLIISASECFFFLCVGVACVCQSVTTRVPLPNGLTAFSALVSRPSASVH